jgi:hypothetical protein
MDLGGEVEIWLGEGDDAEKYIINRSSVVYIPKNIVHHPTQVLRVDRPFIIVLINNAPDMAVTQVDAFPPSFSMEK